MERLEKEIDRFYKIIKQAEYSKVYYDDDSDGAVGALYLDKILKGRFVAKKNIHYTVKEALQDIGECAYKDCQIILVDLGSSEQSREAIKIIKSAGLKIYIIDHHPSIEDLKEISLNPMFLYEDGSKYTAGYLCYKLYKKEFEEDIIVDSTPLWRISIAGDKSELGYSKEERIKALVFDYLAYHNSPLSVYKKTIEDRNLFLSIKQTVEEKIEEIEYRAKKNLKEKNGIYIINLDKVIGYEFPGRGKTLGIICSYLGEYTIIGYAEGIIMVRTSKDINLLEILEPIKRFSISFGGHKRAIAIRTRRREEREIIDLIIELLSKQLKINNKI